MEEQKAIKIVIAGKAYWMKHVDREKHELYKLAEKRVNEKILGYHQRNIKDLQLDDLLALMVFEDELEVIKARQKNFVGSEEKAKLQEIENKIEEYLNDISLERAAQ